MKPMHASSRLSLTWSNRTPRMRAREGRRGLRTGGARLSLVPPARARHRRTENAAVVGLKVALAFSLTLLLGMKVISLLEAMR